MAQKLDNRPGSIYDPEEESERVPKIAPNDGLEDAWNESNKPDSDVASGIADAERYANSSDGQKSAVGENEPTARQDPAETGVDDNKRGNFKTNLKQAKGTSRNKKIAAGIGVGLVISAVGVVMLLPSVLMKTITEKLSDTFMGRAKYAVEQRAELYVTRYVNNVIGGSMRTCGYYVSRDCVSVNPDRNTLFGKLAGNLRENRIETKLLEKQGIEFRLNPNQPNEIIVFKNGVRLGGPDGHFGRREVSREVTKAIKVETKFDGVMTRRHIRSVLATKYGAKKWCFIACSQRDALDDAKITGVKKLKLRMIARVAELTSARTSAYLLCLSVGCTQAELERGDRAIVSEILSRTDTRIVSELIEDMEKFGTRDLSQLIIRKTVANILEKAGSTTAAQTASTAVPIAGQIYFAATIAELLTNLDEKLKDREISKYLRQVNAQASVMYAAQIISASEDTQSFQASVSDSWGAFNLLNGFAESRAWQGINGIENKSTISCKDNVVLSGPNDPLVCPEKKIQPTLAIEEFRNNPVVNAAVTLANRYTQCLGSIPVNPLGVCPTPRDFIKPILEVVNTAIGAVVTTAITVIGALPIIGDIIDSFTEFFGKYALQFFTWASEKLLPVAIDATAEDQEAFDQLALGFDVTGNGFAKGDVDIPTSSGIQGSRLTGDQQASLDRAIAQKKHEDLQGQSIFARYLDINNTSSLASTTTINVASVLYGGRSKMLSEFQPVNIFSTFAMALGIQKQTQAFSTQDRADLFGVTQYGYAIDDPNLEIDPETLTDESCKVYEQIRLASAYLNDKTGETEYSVTNPCALDEIVIDSFTKIYNLDQAGTTTAGGSAINSDVDCDGYSQVSGGVFVRRSYTSDISAQCNNLKQTCQNVGPTETLKIICEAFKFDGVYYGNGYSERYSGAGANEIYGFTASSSNYGLRPESWLANRSEGLSPNNLLECSGLTSVALYVAFNPGKNVGCSGNWTQRNNPDLFRQVSAEEIKPGDFLTKSFSCNSSGGVGGHIAIAASTVDSSGEIIVYETDSWGKPVRFAQKNLRNRFPGGWSRYIGPGAQP